MTVSDVRIRKTFNEGALKAIVSVVIGDCLAIHEIRIISSEDKANHDKLTSEHAETENNLIALKDGILKAVLDKKTYNFLSTHIKNNKIEHIIEAVAGFKKVYTDKKPIQTDNKSSNEPNETDNKSSKDASETDKKSSKDVSETDNKSSED